MSKQRSAFFVVFLLLSVPAGLFGASYSPLLPLLVDLTGWEAESAEAIDLSEAGMKGLTVVREYTNGDRALSAAIMLGSQAAVTWTPAYREGFKAETDEGAVEVGKINGFLVYQVYDKEDHSGGFIVLLLESVADKPDGGGVFVVSFEGVSLDEALKLAQKFDWKKIKDAAAKVH